MFLSQSAYGRYLLFSAAAGIFLGAVYDVFRILHLAAGRERSGAPHLIAVFFGDLLFASFSAVTVILLTSYPLSGVTVTVTRSPFAVQIPLGETVVRVIAPLAQVAVPTVATSFIAEI